MEQFDLMGLLDIPGMIYEFFDDDICFLLVLMRKGNDLMLFFGLNLFR